jgi:hypothetical protein
MSAEFLLGIVASLIVAGVCGNFVMSLRTERRLTRIETKLGIDSD